MEVKTGFFYVERLAKAVSAVKLDYFPGGLFSLLLREIQFKPFTLLLAFLVLMSSASYAETDTYISDDRGYEVRGVVSANNRAALSVNFREKVVRLPFKEGEAFSKGDLLIAFDCTVTNAQYQAARADYQVAKSRYENQAELLSYNATGELDVELAKAEMNKTIALRKAAQGKAKNCAIKAPFAGRVAVLNTRLYETPGPEQLLIEIIGTESLELQLVVPSSWLVWLKTGAKFPFYVDELEQKFDAVVTRISAEVDAVSSTLKIFAVLDPGTLNVLPGMSGTAYMLDAKDTVETQ